MDDEPQISLMKTALELQEMSVDLQKKSAEKQPALRDLFAMSALQGLLAAGNSDLRKFYVAELAYKYADAMLEARLNHK